jgi:hypothetical protein
MTHQGVRDDGVQARIGDVEGMCIADAELGAFRDSFVFGQALSDGDEGGALLDARDLAGEAFAACEGARDDARAAPRSSTRAFGASAIFAI